MPAIPTFQEFLEKAHCSSLYDLVENKLELFLRRWVMEDFGNVWDEKYDSNFYEWARSSIINNQECKKNTPDFMQYSQALRQLVCYLKRRKQLMDIGSTGHKHKKKPGTAPEPLSPPPVTELTEGEMSEMHIVKRERNQEARRQCIAYYRSLHEGQIICECCGFDFSQTYGELGADFIEVHHLNPISQKEEAHTIDPKTDLVPLCANCHAMIHRYMSKRHEEGVESLQGLQTVMEEKSGLNE